MMRHSILRHPARALNSLVEAAATKERLEAQRNSYVVATERIEHSPLARASMIAAVENEGERDTQNIEVLRVKNSARLFDFIVENVRDPPARGRRLLTPSLILRAHEAAMADIVPDAGTYRASPMEVLGSSYRPPAPQDIPALIEQLCDYIDAESENASPFHLAAYTLWRLLWIHPFSDGNGRVARALCYYVICLKAGGLLPGTPTLPELIYINRTRYYAALEAADLAEREQPPDVSRLEELLAELVQQQLMGQPPLDSSTGAELTEVVQRRISGLSDEAKERIFGVSATTYATWIVGSYLLLYVDGESAIAAAFERQQSKGEPFPLLLAPSQEGEAASSLPGTSQLHLVRRVHLDGQKRYAVYLEPDAAAAISGGDLGLSDRRYSFAGTVYVLRFGSRVTPTSAPTFFDLLIAKHISTSRANT